MGGHVVRFYSQLSWRGCAPEVSCVTVHCDAALMNWCRYTHDSGVNGSSVNWAFHTRHGTKILTHAIPGMDWTITLRIVLSLTPSSQNFDADVKKI